MSDKNVYALFAAARKARDEGNVDEARTLYKRVITEYPAQPEAGVSRIELEAITGEQIEVDASGVPMYFAVTPFKLVVMFICTFGIYEMYWFYKNWVLIKERENSNIMPFWRTFFSPIFCYFLFKRVQASALDLSIQREISPGLLTAGWIVVTLLMGSPDAFWLLGYIAVLFLLPVQALVNDINSVAAPNHDKNERFSGWNISSIVVGGLLFLLVLSGTLLAPKPPS
ncbi:MAG: tetratricopeptide repeat protein [Arenicellales bacterium]|nr:tetratricopeptide repeat protein [Arenicellales bacterium]